MSHRVSSVSVALISALVVVSSTSACGRAMGEPDAAVAAAAEAPPPVQPQAEESTSSDSDPLVLHLDAQQAEAAGVRVDTLAGGRATSVLERPVTLMLDPDRKALVGPRLDAKVVRVTADLGEEVEAGDTLAVLSSVELGRARSAFLAARARYRTADAAYRREKNLYDQDISSEAEVLEANASYREAGAQLEAAREALRLYGLDADEIDGIGGGEGAAPLGDFALRSPVDGRVQERGVSPGQTVGPDETPIHVAAVDRLWAMIEAYEQDVPLLQEGHPVSLTVRSLPGRTFEGTIDWVSYELDPDTRTIEARAVIDNPNGILRGGMFGTARIRTNPEVTYAVIPVDAVQTVGGSQVVFVPGGEEGSYRAVPVELGQESSDGLVEIRAGLTPGDRAVVDGAFDLMSTATAEDRGGDHEG